MWRLIKVLLVLLVLGAIALVVFAYLGPLITPDDFSPPTREVIEPVDLGLG